MTHTFGANDLNQVAIFEKNLKEVHNEVLAALKQMTDDDLSDFHAISSSNYQVRESALGAISAVRIERSQKVSPPPIAFGFGHPSFAAKFDHWARMPKLSLHEVTLLSLGADPSCMNDQSYSELRQLRDRGRNLHAAYTSFLEKREIFSRCFYFTGFGYAAERVATIKRWIDDLNVEVHPEFYAGLEARTKPRVIGVDAINEPNPVQSSNGLTAQETETLLKLIAAMAVKGYAFSPNAKRNQATADIQSDLDQLGISLDQKTILKWVRAACDVLPDN